MSTMNASMADWSEVVTITLNNLHEPSFGSVGSWDWEAALIAEVMDTPAVAESISELDAGQGRDLRTALDDIRYRHFPER